MAPKRGQRLGWEDDYGHTQLEQFVAWEKDCIWWRAATPQEIREAKTVKKEKAPAEDVFDLVPESGDIWKEELIALVVEQFDVSETTAKKRVNQLIARRKLTERLVPRPGNRPAVYLSRTTKNDDQ
jgi:hypothetical protein